MLKNKESQLSFFKSMILNASVRFISTTMTILVFAVIVAILGNTSFFFKLLVIAAFGIGFLASLETIFHYIKIYRSLQDLSHPTAAWLGKNHVEVTFDILRSSDGTRQLRMTRADGPEHYHMEALDSVTHIVLENNVCGDLKINDHATNRIRLIAKIKNNKISSPTAHYSGFPPSVKKGNNTRVLLPSADILLIEQRKNDTFLFRSENDTFLFRFTMEGEYAGDTWHQSVQEAKKQAAFEYGVIDDTWQIVTVDIDDVIQFSYESDRDN